jgi:hypothetical protein
VIAIIIIPAFFASENVIGFGVEEEDRKHSWMEDAESVGPPFFIQMQGLKIENIILIFYLFFLHLTVSEFIFP